MDNMLPLGLLILVAAISGYFFRLLTLSGAAAAAVTGLAVGIGFGVNGLLLLGLFFFSSSLLSKYKRMQKKELEDKHEKGARRDWQQVAANGGTAAAASLLYYLLQDPVWLIAFSVAIASSNADTWASEVGTLSRKPPYFIRNFSRVEKGTSGAVSLLGTVAAIIGSLVISLAAARLFDLNDLAVLVLFLFGFLGNVIDTIMGAFGQAAYVCQVCGIETEKRTHCRQQSRLVRGIPFMNNDTVNFFSGFIASVSGIIAYIWLL